MAVEMVAEVDEPTPQRLKLVRPDDAEALYVRPVPAPQRTPSARPVVQYPSEQVLAVIETLARFLALRALLFLGFVIASVLGYLVIADPSPMRLVALGGWAVLIYLPVVLLNARQR